MATEPVTISDTDLQIIRHLEKDPRCPVVRIAEALNMPESTIRNRMNRLVEAGVVEFAAMINPLHFGYQVWAIILVQADVAKISAVADRLAKVPELYFVGIAVGTFDVFAAGLFRSNQELLEFVKEQLPKTPGVVRTSISSILEIVKRTIPSGLPNGARRAGPKRSETRRAVNEPNA
jgi:Lrp/AsnC family transcriptional regulator, regulator for asnA, asnC and gidA